MEIEIGKGGKNGQDGGDTIVKFISHDNQIVDTLRAKGGKAGAPSFHGDLTSFERTLTKEEFEAGARISTILLAEIIHFYKDGLINLLSACWDLYKAPNLPFSIPLHLLLVFSFSTLNVHSVINCKIRIKNPDGNILIEEHVKFEKVDVNQHKMVLTQFFTIEATKYGIWTIDVVSGNILLASQLITVTSI